MGSASGAPILSIPPNPFRNGEHSLALFSALPYTHRPVLLLYRATHHITALPRSVRTAFPRSVITVITYRPSCALSIYVSKHISYHYRYAHRECSSVFCSFASWAITCDANNNDCPLPCSYPWTMFCSLFAHGFFLSLDAIRAEVRGTLRELSTWIHCVCVGSVKWHGWLKMQST